MDWLKIDKVAIFTGTDENGNRYLSRFLKDYKEAFPNSDPNAGCQRCLDDYYHKLIKHISVMKTVKNESGYVLKKKYENIPLHFGSKILVNNTNMTKEYGEKLLERKKGKDLFEKVPDNAGKASAKKEEKLTDLTRKQLDAKAKKLGLNPKDYANKDEIATAIEAVNTANVSEASGEGTETTTDNGVTGEASGEGTE